MKIREIMTPGVQCIDPNDTLVGAAELMRQIEVGALPVCEHGRVLGMITDRDIVIRAIAAGRDPATTAVLEVMTAGAICVREDHPLKEAVRTMEKHQIRRAPVVDRDNHLVGIISLGDIAVDAAPEFSAEALREVSRPAAPVR